MIRLTKDNAINLHHMMASATGGSIGVREEALLESALESAFLGFGDMEFFPTIEEKAAKIGFSLVSNHAFVDGNKRIGVFVMLVFLEANGIRLNCTDEELVSVALSLAKSEYGYEDLLNWILKHESHLK